MRRAALLIFCLLSAGAQAPEGGDTVRLTREPGLSAPARGVLSKLPPGVRAGVLVVDLRTRAVLETQAPDDAFIPASTIKLITASSVLDERGGSSGAWTAELTVPAAQVGRAQVSHLTLRGSGDPTLAVTGAYSLRALAQQAYAHGVRQVGQVRLDQTPLSGAWAQTPLGLPMTALRLAEWRVRPPATAAEAQARLGAALVQELRRAGISVASAQIGRAAPFRPYVPPARTDDQGRPLPPDPWIPLAQRPEQGVASVRSASPARVLAAMLRPSDNLRAEELLATLAHRPGGNGTLAGALARERAWLRRVGVDLRGVRLADGSGLSRENRLTARALVTVLRAQYDLPHPLPGKTGLPGALYRTRGNAFIEALPQAGTGENVPEHDGRGGTLARRLLGAGLDVRAKTGTLPGVSALAGYVTGRSGHPLAFAILMNGPEDAPILTLRALQDELVQELAARY
ncbi:D-alanyl-D-alanine carboxypeptidase/D-alanyl-D-alanine-endopeptidase [Deinococcus aquaedulcis]|uniref:D-alanyl-D-alanine carboxypeptidase/D-alanyl-D-alanine-endopeptidase n=1 Tax=Deinococcus aquaedulcis TaxID=2840455 RepID=UPI001C8336CD|nr:D-alanyl-D-alanine carboxypeptidase [Deinococcus aquaedulcis]